jgi:predicted nucleic acid-binding protein
MSVTLDTTFFVLHYFSAEKDVLAKTRRVLQSYRKLGRRGLLPTMVLAEFYALTYKRAGRDVAEKYFNEVAMSGLKVADLTVDVAKEAGVLRRRYEERLPWGDCIIAATGILHNAETVITEDPHFREVAEIRERTLAELKL